MIATSPTLGFCLITLWLGWRLQQTVHSSKEFRRKQITLVEYPSWLGRFVCQVRYLFKCPDILLRCYGNGIPFAVPTPDSYFVHVSSKAHIAELNQAPENTLSLHAFSKDLLQAKYTMDGIEFDDNMSENGAIHSRVIGVMLKNQLDDLQPDILATISAATAKHLSAGQYLSQDWTEVNSFDFTTNVVTHANAVVFFGAQLADNPDFIELAMGYPKDLFVMAELLRFLPSFIRPCAAMVLKRSFNTQEKLVAYLLPLVERRMQSSAEDSESHRDLIQFFITASRRKDRWSAHRIVQVILGVWFASVHQPALTLVSILDDLFDQPEAARFIQEEILTHMAGQDGMQNIEQLPILDSFLKESARLHPSDSITARRKVIKPFTFGDGTKLERNDVVCVPLEAVMRDDTHYPRSQVFDPYRHMNTQTMASTSRLSDSSPNFPIWGLGRHACPGRHYASRLMKLTVAHLLTNYDIEMAGSTQRHARFFSWRTSILPSSACKIRLRRKAV